VTCLYCFLYRNYKVCLIVVWFQEERVLPLSGVLIWEVNRRQLPTLQSPNPKASQWIEWVNKIDHSYRHKHIVKTVENFICFPVYSSLFVVSWSLITEQNNFLQKFHSHLSIPTICNKQKICS
jgi:hypothetical protein